MSHLITNGSTCLILIALAPTVFADSSTGSAADDSPKQLSVAPLDHIVYPEDRPDWVESSLGFDRDSVRIVVVSGPADTAAESLEELKVMQRAAVSTYVAQIADSGDQYEFYPISDNEIDDELVIRRYSGTVIQGGMKKYEHAVELGFTKEKRQEIVASWNNIEVRHRLGALGAVLFGGLVTLIGSSLLIGVFSRRIERRQATHVA